MIHKILSNGQHAVIDFNWESSVLFVTDVAYDIWNVGFVIGDSEEECLTWLRDPGKDLSQTGRCGLEGLLWAKQELMRFIEEHSRPDYYQLLQVAWSDLKRKNVYKKRADLHRQRHI